MKLNAIVLLSLAVVSVTLFADESPTPSKEAPAKAKRVKRLTKPSGGFLELANTGKVIQVVNDAKSVCPDAVFDRAVGNVKGLIRLPFATTAKSLTGRRDDCASARVVLVARDDSPVLLCAPEEGWCELNVKPLLADSPNDYAFKMRVEKELMRALGFALGCGNSAVQPCVLTEIDSLAKLDGAARQYGPEAYNMMIGVARYRGSEFSKFVSYRRACQEGWAPEPTNDVQKAIWKETHELPTKPIKIEFDPKQGK